MSVKKNFPTTCPSCGGVLSVKSLQCAECQTTVQGEFAIHPLLRLSADEQQFVHAFIMCSGSLKQMAADMGLSYPKNNSGRDTMIDAPSLLEPAQLDELNIVVDIKEKK